jgi:hypothetical protein
MHFFFNQKKMRQSVCKCVSDTPKLKLHIMCKYMEKVDLGFGELSGLAWLIAHP